MKFRIVFFWIPTSILLVSNILFFSVSSAEEGYSTAVHINEFLPNPIGSDSELEFIELYNDSVSSVDISGWVIDTGGNAQFTIDSGTIFMPNSFLTFFSADKNISMTNSGDSIQLRRPDAVAQDTISYTTSTEGYSYIRTQSGLYEENSSPTPNAANTVPVTPTPTPTPVVYSSDIHVSEFLPNPTGDDDELEFVELHNQSSSRIDISGWVIDTGATSRFTITSGTNIEARAFLAFFSALHDISLSNSSDHVQLIRPDALVQDDVSYTESKEGYSYNRNASGVYEQSFTPTPNAPNTITASPSPTPKITATPKPTSEEHVEDVTYDFSPLIVINELLPSPIGADEEGEFIEIKNTGNRGVQLFGWTLHDATKGTGYRFPKGYSIGPKKILAISRAVTKIALNNTSDTVQLLDPKGNVISRVTYTKPVPEGQSFNRMIDGAFVWSKVLTPHKENVIEAVSLPTPKPTRSPTSVTRKKTVTPRPAAVAMPTVLAIRTEKLPWPEHVSRTVVMPRTPSSPMTGKQHAFVLLGTTAAFLQIASGISHKENIWRR